MKTIVVPKENKKFWKGKKKIIFYTYFGRAVLLVRPHLYY